MLPEVEKYFDAMTNHDYSALVQAEQDNPVPVWSLSLSAEDRAAYYAADDKRQAAVRKVDHDWKEREAQALEGLRNSGDPLVKWIVNHPVLWGTHRTYASEVLRALPMNRAELEEFARTRWGGEGHYYIAEADQAGVFTAPEQDQATA